MSMSSIAFGMEQENFLEYKTAADADALQENCNLLKQKSDQSGTTKDLIDWSTAVMTFNQVNFDQDKKALIELDFEKFNTSLEKRFTKLEKEIEEYKNSRENAGTEYNSEELTAGIARRKTVTEETNQQLPNPKIIVESVEINNDQGTGDKEFNDPEFMTLIGRANAPIPYQAPSQNPHISPRQKSRYTMLIIGSIFVYGSYLLGNYIYKKIKKVQKQKLKNRLVATNAPVSSATEDQMPA